MQFQMIQKRYENSRIGMLTNANLIKEIATLEAARVILLNAVVPVRCHECEKACTKQCWFFRQDEHTGTMCGPDDNFFCADGKRREPRAPDALSDIPY